VSAGAEAKGPDHLYLTTTGRRSGLPREIEIWFTAHGGRYFVIAEHREQTGWVQNILADAHVQVRVGDRSFAARARVIDPAREPGLSRGIQELSERKYGWGDGLVVELDPRVQ